MSKLLFLILCTLGYSQGLIDYMIKESNPEPINYEACLIDSTDATSIHHVGVVRFLDNYIRFTTISKVGLQVKLLPCFYKEINADLCSLWVYNQDTSKVIAIGHVEIKTFNKVAYYPIYNLIWEKEYPDHKRRYDRLLTEAGIAYQETLPPTLTAKKTVWFQYNRESK